jgi:hypothetical protein
MTCLRYPATDPYYPGHVIHLRGDEDPHEFVRAMPRAVEFIECDCRAAQRVSGVSGGADERLSEYTGTTTKAAPAGASTPGVRGPDPYEGGALTQDSRVSSSVVLDG